MTVPIIAVVAEVRDRMHTQLHQGPILVFVLPVVAGDTLLEMDRERLVYVEDQANQRLSLTR